MREIEKRKLLVVEGKEDERFFAELLRCLQIEDIQILPVGGKSFIYTNLSALKTRRGFPQLLSLGIVRDADDNPSSAFQSVCGALEKAGLPVPEAPLITTETKPRVTVLVLPGKDCPGVLEDICLEAVKEDSAIPCVEEYFRCLGKKGITLPSPVAISKAKVHTFLSSKKDPEKRLGEAAEAGYWPWENSAFNIIKQFLQVL